MKQLLREKGMLFLVFLTFYIILEIVTFEWLGFRPLPNDVLLDLFVVFGVSSLILLIKSNKLVIVYLSVIFAMAMALFLINATMYSVYFDLFTLKQLQLIGEAADVFSFDHLSLASVIVGFIISVMYLVSMILTYRMLRKKHIEMHGYYHRAALMFVASLLLVFTFFSSHIKAVDQYNEQTNITTFKRASLEKYGLLGYYTKEAENIWLTHRDTTENPPTTNTSPDNTYPDNTDIPDNTENPDNTDSPGNVDVVPVDESQPTDYFGLLEGMNVMSIMIESGQQFAINEYLTPNLYMLSHDGLNFVNSHSENKTNVSEMIGIAGNYPTVNFLPENYDYDLSFAIPNVLDDTYDTSFFHDNLPSFYKRGSLMPQLGFEHIYFHEDLFPGREMYGWSGDFTLDTETIDKIIPHILDQEEPFYSFWTTLSTHGPYNYGQQNIDLFKELGYTDKVIRAEEDGLWINPVAFSTEENIGRIRFYEAAMVDLDDAIGKLIQALKDNNMFDNTLFVLYGDHNVYYHDLHLIINQTTADEYYRMEMYKTFMCMYNPTLNQTYRENSGTNSGEIDKFVSPYNVVPTILDLLGKTYNTNLYMGSSVFSDESDVFYSNKLTSLFNDLIFSDDGNKVKYKTEEATDEDVVQFLSQCQIVIQRINYIDDWYLSTMKEKP